MNEDKTDVGLRAVAVGVAFVIGFVVMCAVIVVCILIASWVG